MFESIYWNRRRARSRLLSKGSLNLPIPPVMSVHSHHPPSYTKTLRDSEDKKRIPAPSHRHAAPSAPWPWIDIHDGIDAEQLASEAPPIPRPCDHKECTCWIGYPQSRFPNWTEAQVERSRIADAIKNYNKNVACVIYHVDVDTQGFFTDAGKIEAPEHDKETTWKIVVDNQRPDNLRVRALFLENLSGPVLQMLGAKFNIEPFFFSSSLSWIPSRYQEEIQPGKGDHITISLTFLKSLEGQYSTTRGNNGSIHTSNTIASTDDDRLTVTEQMIDTQAPLRLRSSRRILVLDLLSVHLIRHVDGSTIISYHPSSHDHTTPASYLHDRIRFAGQSVYWQNIFQKSPDPTFVLLTFVWHAMYAWDEALQHLYTHICWLETKVLGTQNMELTQELHIIRAHHLHYSSLLEDFQKTVKFIQNTPNPAMQSASKEDQENGTSWMRRECANLLSEIDRLEMGRRMQDKRLKNVMNLVFSRMKQIAYLTMVFLPASFVAAVFGMNIKEVAPDTHGTLPHYLLVAVPLTVATIWIVVAFQSRYIFPEGTSFWVRMGWPVTLCLKLLQDKLRPENQHEGTAGEEKTV
ncbi:hypothetical protein Hypma_013163 [Hypsizygus marmoreus]|uniref:Magnesium transport protein CorA n=1 Tax=Hypsizygus marmoreus TaxID=39966 RepID=A0A369JET2_HYPMA|nr:hypothetical protein Hypma_013163 [Hypsizygus marmoreus]